MASWQLADMSNYFTGVMAQAGSGAKFVGQDGTVTYVFGNDGVASVEADNFKMTLAVDVQGTTLNIIVSINGRATANYHLERSGQDHILQSADGRSEIQRDDERH